jgi:vitamin B12 transporter
MFQIKRLCRYVLGFFLFYPAVLFAQTASNGAALSAVTAPAPVEASANSANADHTTTLEPVVVTANRLDTPASQVTGSLSVLAAKDLEQKQARTMQEALQGESSLYVAQTGGPGSASSLYTRGASSEATLVMVDGIPLNDPDSTARSFDYLDQFPLEGVRQVEILRGPQSVLYGSNAMAGVVNILTPSGEGPLGASAQFEGGSYGTFRESADAQGGDAAGHFSLSLSQFDTAGYPSLDEASGGKLANSDANSTGSLVLGAQASDELKGNLLVRYGQSRTNLNAFDPLSYTSVDDPDYFVDQKQLVLGGNATLTQGDWQQVFGISFMDNDRNYNGTPDGYTTYFEHDGFDGQAGQFSWQNNLKLMPQETLVAGIQGQQEWAASSNNNSFETTPPVANSARMGSAFAESQTNLEDRLFVNLGGRVDDHSQFGTHGTWQLGLAYFIPGVETKLKANYGTGFLAPTLFQLYDPSSGNAGLQPEVSQGFDLGFEQPIGSTGLRFAATYFREDYSELIDFEPTGPATGQYFNVGEARTEGLEASAEFQEESGLKLKAEYTYVEARDLQTGEALIRRPANQATLEASRPWGDLETGFSLNYVDARLDDNFNTYPATVVTLPSYFLLNLAASCRLDAHWKLFARVDNLLNQNYEEVYGYRTSGLSGYGGIKLSM